MSWVKLDDQFFSHPKAREAGPNASLLYLAGLTYCARHLTDGKIPKSAVAIIAAEAWAKASNARILCDVEFWHDEGDHYTVNGYLEFNPSKEQVEKVRRDSRERRANAGRRSARVRASDANPDPSPTDPDGSEDARAPFEAEFEELWYFWPKKLDKAHALEQYQARRRAGRTQAELMRAVVEFTEHHQAQGGDLQFMPYLKTFIGAKGQWVEWLDGVPIDAVPNADLGVSAWKPEPVSGPTLVPEPDQPKRALDDERKPCPLGLCGGTGYVDVPGEKAARACRCRTMAATA